MRAVFAVSAVALIGVAVTACGPFQRQQPVAPTPAPMAQPAVTPPPPPVAAAQPQVTPPPSVAAPAPAVTPAVPPPPAATAPAEPVAVAPAPRPEVSVGAVADPPRAQRRARPFRQAKG